MSNVEDEIEKLTNLGYDLIDRRTDTNYSLKKDITGRSNTNAEFSDFVKLFRDRYNKLQNLIKRRMGSVNTVNSISSNKGEEVKIIGMVREIRQTYNPDNQYKIMEVEDTTGSTRAVISDDDLLDKTERIVSDEVVGIEGNLSDDGNVIFTDNLYYPNIPELREPSRSETPLNIAMVSDLHFGSKLFSNEQWKNFVDWVSHNSTIEYLIVAGDLVEGIGVYPNQEEELLIKDIKDQYRLCAEAFSEFPDDLKIIASMGNHDRVRLAEPQPALKQEFLDLFPDNVEITGNPINIEIEGVNIMSYHGMSINSFADAIPGLDMRDPEEIMQLMLEKRHLAPMFGKGVRISPEEEDYMVLEDIPDVLVSGHVHKIGAKEYNGVKIVNPGCWVGQTNFQEKLNIDPDVGYASIMNLKTGDMKLRQF